jgi:hypothetical protein
MKTPIICTIAVRYGRKSWVEGNRENEHKSIYSEIELKLLTELMILTVTE